jgi:hypothetical protein
VNLCFDDPTPVRFYKGERDRKEVFERGPKGPQRFNFWSMHYDLEPNGVDVSGFGSYSGPDRGATFHIGDAPPARTA